MCIMWVSKRLCDLKFWNSVHNELSDPAVFTCFLTAYQYQKQLPELMNCEEVKKEIRVDKYGGYFATANWNLEWGIFIFGWKIQEECSSYLQSIFMYFERKWEDFRTNNFENYHFEELVKENWKCRMELGKMALPEKY